MTTAERELSPFRPENRVLRDDIDRCLTGLGQLTEEHDQFIRRMLVRATFAFIEGIIFQFKRSTAGLLLAQHFQSLRRDAEAIRVTPYTGYLCDTSYVLADNGDLQERTQFIQLKTNIQYTFKVAADTYRSSYVLDKGSGWQAFLRAIKVRDRIT